MTKKNKHGRLIDADALIDDCKKYLNKLNPSRDGKECTRIHWLIGVLSNAPIIEPERKIGKWMWSSDEYGESWICSECMAEYSDFEGFKDEAKYCPNCGADLREGAEQE